MSQNWIRYIKLTVDVGGTSFDLSNFRIKFKIKQWTQQAPGIAEVRVYNLSKQTRAQIAQKVLTKMTLEAGYADNHGLLFKGWVEQKRQGHETPTETFLDLFAQDGQKAYNYAVVNKTLPANSTAQDVYDEALKKMKEKDDTIEKGYIGPDLKSMKYPKAFTMYGMARKFMRDLSHATNSTWSIQNGKVQFLKNDAQDSTSSDQIKVSSATGMIMSPVQTYDGIIVRHLINPQFEVGKKIKIDQSSIIQEQQWDLSYGGLGRNSLIPPLSQDGVYRILAIDWVGDTNMQPWYADLTTYSADPGSQIPASQASLGRGQPRPQ